MLVILLFGFLAVLFACLSQKSKVPVTDTGNEVAAYKYENFSGIYFTISFLLLAVPCFLCGSGTDIPAYVRYYERWTFADLQTLQFEPGYILLNLFLRIFFSNAYIGLGIIKVISIFLVFKSLYMLRDRVHLGFSVLSYVVLLYIISFQLLRISLACGMFFLAMAYELTGKSKRAVVWSIAAFFFHYTSIIGFLAYCIYKMLGKKITIVKIALWALVLVILYANIVPILQYLIFRINFLDKYKTYLNRTNLSGGLAQAVLFIPVAYILASLYKQGKEDKFYIMNTIFGVMLFFTGSLGYLFSVFSRSIYYFCFCAMTLFAATPLVKDKIVLVIDKKRINFVTLFGILYLLMQAVITFIFNKSFVSSGLTQYTFWWNL